MPSWFSRRQPRTSLERLRQSQRDRPRVTYQAASLSRIDTNTIAVRDQEAADRVRRQLEELSNSGYMEPTWQRQGYNRYVSNAMQEMWYEQMSGYYSTTRLWPSAKDVELSDWMFETGLIRPIKDMTIAQLNSAIKYLKEGKKCGGQESKIISLEKERSKRDATNR